MSDILNNVSNCKMCGAICKIKKNNKGKYCSFSCQQEFQYLEWIKKWLSGEIIVSSIYASNRIRKFLFESQNGKCLNCQLSTWNNLPIALHLDHVDGNFLNNKCENLRLLCPNCHALTSNYKAKNKNKGRKMQSILIIRSFNE